MRAFVLVLLLGACGGPQRNQLAETPTAQTPRTPSLAPPASDSDKDRYKTNEQFENIQDAQQAHREAAGGESAPPPAPLPPDAPPSPPPKKPKK